MHWRDYVTGLPPETQEQLLDGILIGFRHLHYAVEAARAQAPTIEVLGALGVTYTAFRDVLTILDPSAVPASEGAALYGPVSTDRLTQPWDGVKRISQGPATIPAALLQSVEEQARAAAEKDADVPTVQAHLTAALAALVALRQAVAAETAE